MAYTHAQALLLGKNSFARAAPDRPRGVSTPMPRGSLMTGRNLLSDSRSPAELRRLSMRRSHAPRPRTARDEIILRSSFKFQAVCNGSAPPHHERTTSPYRWHNDDCRGDNTPAT